MSTHTNCVRCGAPLDPTGGCIRLCHIRGNLVSPPRDVPLYPASSPSLIEPIGSTPPNPVNSNHENDGQTEEVQGDRGVADRRSQPLHPEQHGGGGTGVRPHTSAPIGHAPSEAPALQGVPSPIGSTPTTALVMPSLECDRNWPEDFGHENGQYLNGCIYCSLSFVGHKRRRICKTCADKQLAGGEAGGEPSTDTEILERAAKMVGGDIEAVLPPEILAASDRCRNWICGGGRKLPQKYGLFDAKADLWLVTTYAASLRHELEIAHSRNAQYREELDRLKAAATDVLEKLLDYRGGEADAATAIVFSANALYACLSTTNPNATSSTLGVEADQRNAQSANDLPAAYLGEKPNG